MGNTQQNSTKQLQDKSIENKQKKSFFSRQKKQKKQQKIYLQDEVFHVNNIVFPLATNKKLIVDKQGKKVKFAGVNWSGAHMCRHCVDGLEFKNIQDIAYDIRFKFKMNLVRVTYSLQMIFDSKSIPDKYLKANPHLCGKVPLEVFDITIQTLTSMGLMVILNNHISTSQWCCSNDDGDGLWWSRQYPQYLYFQHVDQLSKRYTKNPRVIGIDLRNQIRKAHGLQPTWGDGVPKSDWKRAAEKAGEIALKNAPHWLIFVGGINYQLDLTPVRQHPITLSIPNRVVYTGHFYAFSWKIPSWSSFTYENFRKKMYTTQLYVRGLGYPYILGQFGSSSKDIPWKYLLRYIKQADLDWIYWSIDGFKCEPEKDEPFGIYNKNFSGIRHPQILDDLIEVGAPKQALESLQYCIPEQYKKWKAEQCGEDNVGDGLVRVEGEEKGDKKNQINLTQQTQKKQQKDFQQKILQGQNPNNSIEMFAELILNQNDKSDRGVGKM